MSPRTLLIALHDVTPFHRPRLERAERLLDAFGVRHVAYLLVPDYHGVARADASPAFVDWCRGPRRFEVQWLLHGYFHDDRRRLEDGAAYRPTFSERLSARYATAGEAECIGLGPTAVRARLTAGTAVFAACLGARPSGFVAPAWLFNRYLLPALADLRFELTESHHRVFHLPTGRVLKTPTITWATRTAVHRVGSRATAAAIARLFAREPVVRVALHPYDFDHDATVASIARTLDRLCRDRSVVRCDASLFGDPPRPAVLA